MSQVAAAYGRREGVHVIAGGCPLMFGRAADTPHKVMRFVAGMTGALPKEV